MNSLPNGIRAAVEDILGESIREVTFVGGGDINEARRVSTGSDGYFLKMNRRPEAAEMLNTEAYGLRLLEKPGHIRTPKVIGNGQAGAWAFLLLEFIESGENTGDFWKTFGHALAQLHRESREQFGLEHHNFIGSLRQYNYPHDNWIDFYISERLSPQLKMAIDRSKLGSNDRKAFEQLYKKLPGLLSSEPPALIHGDLWSGNYLCGPAGEPVLIDPAAAYAHREMDLAMSHLFGGFAPAFYQAYRESYPLPPGLKERIPVYQLYYLMVHVNLFGGGYISSVRQILDKHRL